MLTDQDRKYVYVLGPEQHAPNAATCKLGRHGRAACAWSTSGLAAGDRVIVHGVQKVFFPGMTVDPTEIAMGDPPPAPLTSQK